MDLATALKVGDVCLDCQQQGIEKHLRYFKLNLEGDTLLKCESNACMYPYNDEMSSSEEDEEFLENESNGLKLIDDLFQQTSNAKVEENTNYVQLIEDLMQQNDGEPANEFEISFLNALEDEFKKENTSNTLTSTQNQTPANCYVDNKLLQNTEPIDDKSSITMLMEQTSLPLLDDTKHFNQSAKNCNKDFISKFKEHILSLPTLDTDKNQLHFVKDFKPKIEIQSVKTIKTEPFIDNLPSISSKSTSLSKVSINKPKARYKSISLPTASFLSKSTTWPNLDVINSFKSVTLEKSAPILTSNISANDIPKANIINGSAFLEQLKTKGGRKRNKVQNSKKFIKIKNNIKIKKELLTDDSDNIQDSCKSSADQCDVLSKFLNKFKN